MSDDSEHEHARVADEARRRAGEAEARARVEAERIVAGTETGEMKEEMLRQIGVMYGGLIAIAVVMVQGFLEASSLDASALAAFWPRKDAQRCYLPCTSEQHFGRSAWEWAGSGQA